MSGRAAFRLLASGRACAHRSLHFRSGSYLAADAPVGFLSLEYPSPRHLSRMTRETITAFLRKKPCCGPSPFDVGDCYAGKNDASALAPLTSKRTGPRLASFALFVVQASPDSPSSSALVDSVTLPSPPPPGAFPLAFAGWPSLACCDRSSSPDSALSSAP